MARIPKFNNASLTKIFGEKHNIAIERSENDLFSGIKNAMNSHDVKKFFRMGSAIAGALQPFIEKPSWWNMAGSSFAVAKACIDDIELWADDFFAGDEWIYMYPREFIPTVMQVLNKYPARHIKCADDGIVVKITTVNGCEVGWIQNLKVNSVDKLFANTKDVQLAKTVINKALWEMHKNQPIVMRKSTVSDPSTNGSVVFETDEINDLLQSKKSIEYTNYLKRCFAANEPRSVMFYGPPGTGKSTLARALISNLNLKSFRIRVEDVSTIENHIVFEAINIFKPDAIIFDDFDRTYSQEQCLETLEFFRKHVKLVVATVNDKNKLDAAILRPGRFDELVLVDKMDEIVVKKVLGDYVDGFDDVKNWPIAFIQEYVKRRRFMSKAEASQSTVELARRVRELSRGASEDEEMLQRIASDSDESLEEEDSDPADR
jgi:hypothetical protein